MDAFIQFWSDFAYVADFFDKQAAMLGGYRELFLAYILITRVLIVMFIVMFFLNIGIIAKLSRVEKALRSKNDGITYRADFNNKNQQF